jgi:hypothetical protein
MNEARFRTVWTVILATAIISESPPSGCAQGNDKRLPRATVHVSVFGPFGSKIKTAEVHLHSLDGKTELRASQDLVIRDVPYGEYTLTGRDEGGSGGKREIVVNARDIWLNVGLAFPTGDRLWPGGDLSISGQVSPAPPGGDWWARAEGVFLHADKESPISSAGKFSLDGLEMGTYLVEVFEGAKLRHVETVEIDPKQPSTHLTISIEPNGAGR